ncbi:hypothetical protein COOONC_08481 [Cooperia oncophora]
MSNEVQEIFHEEMNSSDEEYSDGHLFETEMKPTLEELLLQSSGNPKATEKSLMTQKDTRHSDFGSETASTSAGPKASSSTTSLAREVLSCFSDSLSQLLDEEAKLARIRQEEAAMAVEVRRLEIEKLNLEIELLRRKAELEPEASNGTCSSYYD